ncbi:MAG: SDR family NAD(P)-dependent oxidoreductase [Clostridia bacterium]|nr:SDR family NAD(P)-dependent oxidoreductase [Clostridia bacterium]
MKALVTGASSGIGRDIARALVCRGWDVILVARRADRLMELKKELGKHASCVRCDVSRVEECIKLHEVLQKEDIEMLVNCAGFGLCGFFTETSLDKELEMIDTNIKAVHVLTKLFLQDFMLKNKGYILNVASIAGFFSGPLMATYYATKNYVVSMTGAIYEELKRRGSSVQISALCPGPVDTEFNKVAHVKFSSAPIDSKTAATQALDGLMAGKLYIVPTVKMKCLKFVKRLLPDKTITHFCYSFQKKKR